MDQDKILNGKLNIKKRGLKQYERFWQVGEPAYDFMTAAKSRLKRSCFRQISQSGASLSIPTEEILSTSSDQSANAPFYSGSPSSTSVLRQSVSGVENFMRHCSFYLWNKNRLKRSG